MYARQIKRKCSVRGCKNTDTFAISMTREIGNTVIICKSCLEKALVAIDEVRPETKTNIPVKESAIPPLFFNGAIKGMKKSTETPTQEPNGDSSTDVEDISKEEASCTCPICGKICKSESGLQKHMATHKDDKE